MTFILITVHCHVVVVVVVNDKKLQISKIPVMCGGKIKTKALAQSKLTNILNCEEPLSKFLSPVLHT